MRPEIALVIDFPRVSTSSASIPVLSAYALSTNNFLLNKWVTAWRDEVGVDGLRALVQARLRAPVIVSSQSDVQRAKGAAAYTISAPSSSASSAAGEQSALPKRLVHLP